MLIFVSRTLVLCYYCYAFYCFFFFFFKQKTAYEIYQCDWSSDVCSSDLAFDRAHVKQLLGHTLPIAAALIGLTTISRMSDVPLGKLEGAIIMAVFLAGSILRVMAVYQLGSQAFKFDIVFRDQQTLRQEKLYGWIRHPSYAAMMIVILAYALTTHHWLAGGVGLASAWFGFQYRIHHEEKALLEQFGEEYVGYRDKTGMWFPKMMR